MAAISVPTEAVIFTYPEFSLSSLYLSDNMPTIASAAKAVLYGDYSGLSVNIRENMTVEVLREKYATQHAIGVVAWMELDSKVSDPQKLATLVMSTGA